MPIFIFQKGVEPVSGSGHQGPKIKRIIPSVPKIHAEATEDTPQKSTLRNKTENMRKRREEFLEKGIVMALYGEVEQRVQSACMSTDHLLIQKRTRLRELLLAEEVGYMTEYISMCQQANANREEELRTRAFELQQKNERERQMFSDQKLLQRKVLSCDAARPVMTQKTLMEVKRDQLWQMKEKCALEEARREEERMFHDLMMKNIMALKENDEENAKLTWMKQKDAREAFMKQMEEKRRKEEEEKKLKEEERLQLEEEIRSFKEEEEKGKEDQRQKKEQMKAEMQERLEREREMKERRRREEEEIDRTFSELMKIEEEKEKRKGASNKERLKREMDIFLENSRELRRKKEAEDRKCEEMLQELNEKKRMQKDEERRRLKAAREELFYNVLKEREEQVKEKREKRRREEEQARREIELLTLHLEQQKKIREDYERRCAEEREQYRCQLKKQMEEAVDARRKKREEEEEYVRMKKAEEEKEIEEVKALLRALPIGAKDHPMKAIVKDRPPKYVCPHPCPR